ncbi:hypothetical protein [Actinoplanes sp. NPDC051859]|uniref:hypothetical protein n=1 Tax=Actinoplanes sp. NPDC051859 TaxID=3363909 RepID=UPI00379C696B
MRPAAWDALLARTSAIEAAVGDRFPLYADPETGEWTTTRRGSWAGGFWTGLLRLRAAATGQSRHVAAARQWTARLSDRLLDDTDTRAMTFWYGTRWGADEIAEAGAQALAASASASGVIAVGSTYHPADPGRVSIDTLAAVVALLDHTGRAGLAARHAAALAGLLVNERGAVVPHTGAGADPGWSRGHAWGLLGFAVAADRLDRQVAAGHSGVPFREVAERVAGRWLSRHGHGVPLATSDGSGPVDTSAAMIAAAGLWTLGERDVAESMLDTVTARYLRPDGVLAGGCYDRACAHELIWGTYFLAALTGVRRGLLPAGW